MIFLTLKLLLIFLKSLNYLFPFKICNLWAWLSFQVSECIKTQGLVKLYKPSVSAFKCWKQIQKHIIESLKVVSVNIYIRCQCISLSTFVQLTFSLKTQQNTFSVVRHQQLSESCLNCWLLKMWVYNVKLSKLMDLQQSLNGRIVEWVLISFCYTQKQNCFFID